MTICKTVVDVIRKIVPLRSGMKMMDFGAGPGLVTLALLPHVAGVMAADASGEMLRVLDEKLKALRIGKVHTLLCASGDRVKAGPLVSGFAE